MDISITSLRIFSVINSVKVLVDIYIPNLIYISKHHIRVPTCGQGEEVFKVKISLICKFLFTLKQSKFIINLCIHGS